MPQNTLQVSASQEKQLTVREQLDYLKERVDYNQDRVRLLSESRLTPVLGSDYPPNLEDYKDAGCELGNKIVDLLRIINTTNTMLDNIISRLLL